MTLPVRPPCTAACRSRSRNRPDCCGEAARSTLASVMCSNSRMYSRWSSTDNPFWLDPIPRFGHPSLRNPPPRLQRGYGASLRDDTSGIESFGLVEQVERPVKITVNLPESSLGTGEPDGVWRSGACLLRLLALSHVVRRGLTVVLLAEEVTQPKVQVRESG